MGSEVIVDEAEKKTSTGKEEMGDAEIRVIVKKVEGGLKDGARDSRDLSTLLQVVTDKAMFVLLRRDHEMFECV